MTAHMAATAATARAVKLLLEVPHVRGVSQKEVSKIWAKCGK